MPAPRIGLDIGGVLSARGVRGADGGDIHWAATAGAYVFCVFFMIRHGPQNLFIISRIDSGSWYSTHRGHQIEAWIVRFARSLGVFVMGVPEGNSESILPAFIRTRTHDRKRRPILRRPKKPCWKNK